MAKFTLDEKRVQALRKQLYGKESNLTTASTGSYANLKNDLLKIFLFASIAIFAQLLLFLGERNNLVNIRLFF